MEPPDTWHPTLQLENSLDICEIYSVQELCMFSFSRHLNTSHVIQLKTCRKSLVFFN